MPSDPFSFQEKTTPTTSESIIGGADINPDVLNTFISGGGLSKLPDGNRDGQIKVIMKTTNMCEPLNQTTMPVGSVNDCCIVGDFVYVGGTFTSIQTGLDTNSPTTIANTAGIARYQISTQTWSAMATGLVFGGSVERMVVSPSLGQIYILGTFTGDFGATVSCQGIMIYSIAGNSLFAGAGSGASAGGTIRTMCFDPANSSRYWLGGTFTTMNGTAAVNNIVFWNGAANLLATGCASSVYDIQIYNKTGTVWNSIIVGGDFLNANGVALTQRIACWNSVSIWFSITTSSSLTLVKSILVNNPDANDFVYITGAFTSVNGISTLRVAKYITSTNIWTTLGFGCSAGTGEHISKLADGRIMVTGSLSNFITGTITSQVSPAQQMYLYALYDATIDRWYSGSAASLTSAAQGKHRSMEQNSDGSFYFANGGPPYILKVYPNELLNIRSSGATRTVSKFLINAATAYTNGPVSFKNPGCLFLTDAGHAFTLQWNATLQKWVLFAALTPVAIQYQYNLSY